MAGNTQLIDRVMAGFRERLVEAAGAMRQCRTAVGFCTAERWIHSLALELADAMTAEALGEMVADKKRVAAA